MQRRQLMQVGNQGNEKCWFINKTETARYSISIEKSGLLQYRAAAAIDNCLLITVKVLENTQHYQYKLFHSETKHSVSLYLLNSSQNRHLKPFQSRSHEWQHNRTLVAKNWNYRIKFHLFYGGVTPDRAY